jgi:hypothetical protein
MRQRAGASILNLIACIAAFALVALIAIFGRPAAQPDPAATVTANAARLQLAHRLGKVGIAP